MDITAEPHEDLVSIVLVDDHPLLLEGLESTILLEPDLQVVGKANDGETAIRLIRILKPKIAVIDINLPVTNGLNVTQTLEEEGLQTKVILLTAYDDTLQIIRAAFAGAAGYCQKGVDPTELIRAIHLVSQGKYVIGQRVFEKDEFKQWLSQELKKNPTIANDVETINRPLTKREMDVLSCIVGGMSNKEMAIALGISHQTVKNHITSILRKMGTEDRTQAAVYAIKRGWVKITDSEI